MRSVPNPLILEFTLMKSAHDLVVAAKGRIREIPAEQAEQAIRNADLLIDVREGDEYAAGHIPGAVHMSRGMLEFKLSSNPDLAARDLNMVVYCKTSGRAALACVALQEMGYLHVQSIGGGYDGWIAAGKPVAQPSMPKFE